MIDSEIFGQNQALEKPPRGKPVREREFIISSGKIQTVFYSQNTTYLNQRKSPSRLPRVLCKGCLDFHANIFTKKCAEITATNSPRFLCLRALNAALENSA